MNIVLVHNKSTYLKAQIKAFIIPTRFFIFMQQYNKYVQLTLCIRFMDYFHKNKVKITCCQFNFCHCNPLIAV